jgi:UDP-N-acetylglucosamine--N-acetylmuramyl-(pentapeptide) pyrophosphoryl-undecaprenol N-acetylglucosamine transferase
METRRKYRIIIGGGGTGGHVFPAISIANALKKLHPQAEFLFVGALGRIEMEKVPEAGYEIRGLPVSGFQRKLTLRNISFFFKLIRSMRMATRIIKTFDPDVVVGVGGYASGPILKAASRKGIPTLIQEQNSYAGVTNKLLAKDAEKICVAYSGMERYFPAEKILLTGNPIRQDLILAPEERKNSLASFGLRADRKTILLIGGSLGARTLNDSIRRHLEQLSREDIQLIWQTGKYYYEEAVKAWEAYRAENIKVMAFITEMNRAFQVADLIISRAGAGTISELCLVGKPVILVPSPNVAEDHQTRNARSLTDQKAAVLVPDEEARKDLVRVALDLVKDEVRSNVLSENIRRLAISDSAEKIAGEVLKILDSA